MGEIAGISRQREGQVSNRESVGGVERAVTQSSHITEWWFTMHDQVKKRVIATFLETAKYALKGTNKKINYLTDDMSKQILNVEGDMINEAEYNILVTNSHQTKKVKELTEQMAQSFMQNGGRYSTILNIFNSPSLADMRNRIEQSEDEQAEREAAAQEQQAELAQQAMQQAEATLDREDANKKADRLLKKYEIDTNAMLKQEQVDSVDMLGKDKSIDQAKLELDRQKHSDDLFLEIKKLDADMTKSKEDNKIKKYIADKKPASTTSK